MIQLKSKVTHPKFGKGIVEGLENNCSIATVDFFGEMHKCEVRILDEGWNVYKPKKNADETLLSVRNEILKLKAEFGTGQFAEGGKTACDKLLKRLGL